jgi:3-isopropylmalate/(R)-2-methylmalate dehydratase small subunit
MRPFRRLTAVACPLPIAGIDTDQLIPARFMSRPRSAGYGPFLLHDLRFDAAGGRHADFPLNLPRYERASILVARRNFGSGSSREAAVYALADHGIACVIAPSFGDIFASNAVNNGVLPATVSEAETEMLLDRLRQADVPELIVDLDCLSIAAGDATFGFSIDPVWRTKLLNGWDDLDLTASHAAEIAAFQERDAILRPWVKPGTG